MIVWLLSGARDMLADTPNHEVARGVTLLGDPQMSFIRLCSIAVLFTLGSPLGLSGCSEAEPTLSAERAPADLSGPPIYGQDGLQELSGKEDSSGSSLNDPSAVVLESRYATIKYFSADALDEFNDELYMGPLRHQLSGAHDGTLEGEVMAKIDLIFEKVMLAMDMYPPELRCTIVIHPDVDGVHDDFKALYGIDVGYIAFYSPSRNAAFYSAENTNLDVVSHEIGHVVAENYFVISPPQKIHELLAQYASAHVTD